MTEHDLEVPHKGVEVKDPGAHDLSASESEHDHFSDASEGRRERPGQEARSEAHSPVPITRVERVDDEPAYGEVPGTDAYKMRTQDAVPDEVEIVPDGQRSRSASRLDPADRPLTPGGTPVPKTVVERVDDEPCFGEVPGTDAYKKRLQDAAPDVVVHVHDAPNPGHGGSPTASINRSPLTSELPGSNEDDSDASAAELHPEQELPNSNDGAEEDREDDFGDDFDDFEEGGDEDDFGDFDDGFQGEEQAETTFDKSLNQTSMPGPAPGPPVLGFEELASLENIIRATQPYMDEIYPSKTEIPTISATGQENLRSIFSERSESLWSQLVAPPPLQPPDWVRSRIRRLFLVSLGVPVDLDEILPASKQKKLILPSIHIPGERSPRPSADERTSALGRVRRENESSASLDSSASRSERKRKGPPPPPELDISSTTMLCSTTDAALQNLTNEELQAHVKRLEELKERANEVFMYWQKRMESALGDKDAFESVIENLVAHAKKIR